MNAPVCWQCEVRAAPESETRKGLCQPCWSGLQNRKHEVSEPQLEALLAITSEAQGMVLERRQKANPGEVICEDVIVAKLGEVFRLVDEIRGTIR